MDLYRQDARSAREIIGLKDMHQNEISHQNRRNNEFLLPTIYSQFHFIAVLKNLSLALLASRRF